VERSWDYLLKSSAGFYIAFACSFLLLAAIIAGGIFMRIEMARQREWRQSQKESEEIPENEE
jgi:hypothetical protein